MIGKMNKSAREDTGFTWIVSILIIVSVLVAYLILGVSGAYGSKKLGEDREIVLTEESSRLSVIEDYIGFLDNEINFNGKKILVKDLVEGDLEDNSESWKKFRELSEEFLEDLKSKNFGSSWIRIYEKNEEVKEEFYGKYKKYGAEVSGSEYRGSWYDSGEVACNPNSSKSDIFFVISSGKKIVFCFMEVKV